MQDFNYHIHTKRCGHADKDMADEDYVRECIQKGFKKIAFTDHCPEKEIIDTRSNMRMDYRQKSEYIDSIRFLREKYKGKIEIESGFEVEYLPGQEENLLELKQEVDKIILGQHFIYDDDHRNLLCFRRVDFSEDQLLRYASYIEGAMRRGIPDIIAHPDLYMLGRKEFGDVEEKVARIIGAAAEKYNIPLEINLSEPALYLQQCQGLYIGDWKLDKITYPNRDFWRVISNYNVKVLYGIDAHYKEQIQLYEESVLVANEHIGFDVIEKLDFCNRDLEIDKSCMKVLK